MYIGNIIFITLRCIITLHNDYQIFENLCFFQHYHTHTLHYSQNENFQTIYLMTIKMIT